MTKESGLGPNAADAPADQERPTRIELATFSMPAAYSEGWHAPEPTGRWTAGPAMLPIDAGSPHTHIRLAISNHHETKVKVSLACGPYATVLDLRPTDTQVTTLRLAPGVGFITIATDMTKTVSGDSRKLGTFLHWFEYIVAVEEELDAGDAGPLDSPSPDAAKLVSLAGHVVNMAGDPADAYFAEAEAHAADLDELARRVATLPAGAVILDVGANIGLSAIAMSIAQPFVRVFAFEPNPATYGYLRRNVERFPNVEAIQAAVSDQAAVLHFHASPYAAGSHVVGVGHIHADLPTVDVAALALDAFVAERGIEPSFIKLDVEGHEPEALAGAAKLIERFRPVIYMEFNSWTLNAFAGHSPAAFARAIWDSFDVEGYSQPLQFLHDNLTEHRCVSNITMRLKPGAEVPSLDVMSFPQAALDRLAR